MWVRRRAAVGQVSAWNKKHVRIAYHGPSPQLLLFAARWVIEADCDSSPSNDKYVLLRPALSVFLVVSTWGGATEQLSRQGEVEFGMMQQALYKTARVHAAPVQNQ